MQFNSPKDRLIIAFDFSTLDQINEYARLLANHVGWGKVGLEIMMATSPLAAIHAVKDTGLSVFCDGKFDDIPNTVAGATRNVVAHGANMLNVHASAGLKSVQAAATNKGAAKLLVVTVLTSIDDPECVSIFGDTVVKKVLQFAHLALEAGADGIVCSPLEVAAIRTDTSLNKLALVTPGVRPTWAPADDQKRHLTPGEAITLGADMVVIGRPVTKPPTTIGTPFRAAGLIVDEIQTALAARK